MSLNKYERKVSSQFGQDGIIEHILDVIGEGTKRCVEFGFGEECNTANLLSNHGWRGVLMDVELGVVSGGKLRWGEAVTAIQAFIEPSNIDDILKTYSPPNPDLLSVDIDGMDYHVWKAITSIDPRVVVIEYNASYGPDLSVTTPYSAGFQRRNFHMHYHGASLGALNKLAESRGYALVGCESHGIDAFFVKEKELRGDLVKLSVWRAYQPHAYRVGDWAWQMGQLGEYASKLVEV